MGSPFKKSGISAVSSLSRTPEKSSIASIKPSPAPSAFTSDCTKPSSFVMLSIVIPKTAQFVVIRGK